MDEASPQRTLIASRREYVDAADRLVELAQRELRIFDPDLSGLDFNSLPRIEALQRLLSANRMHRVFIALQDVEHVKTRCPRLLRLVAMFSSALFIFRAEGEAANAQDCFVLADASHVIRRPVAAQARGVVLLNDPKEALPIRERFDDIWACSVPAVSATATGL